MPVTKGKKPEDFVNLKFLQELESDGFFKELYANMIFCFWVDVRGSQQS